MNHGIENGRLPLLPGWDKSCYRRTAYIYRGSLDFEVITMKKHVALENDEWQLIIDLLEEEQKELPAEIHHTDTMEYKERLLNRREIVDKLLGALRQL
jgi:hypothetical protein